METEQARENVVLAGKKLLKSGLIARTWGNVSCRISNRQFVITPSGKAYETLSPGEIVTVNIDDGSYSGEIEPSSEKDLHAEIYKHRKDVNFIIHTHQACASALSPLGEDIPVRDPGSAGSFGEKVACAAYGLPGSQKLKEEATAAFARTEGKAILLAYHGAVCLGKGMEEAFQVASELEKFSAEFACRRYLETSGEEINREATDENILRDSFVCKYAAPSAITGENTVKPLFSSERRGDLFKLYVGSTADEPWPDEGTGFKEVSINETAPGSEDGGLSAEAKLHREIYRRYKKVGAIIHTTLPDILAVSRTGKRVYPLLDDFAQIIGTSALVAEEDGTHKSARKVVAKLKRNSAVMIKGNGALCCGPNKYDASAAVLVLAKNCKAMIYATLLGKVIPINPFEALLMRYIYLKKYSRKI